MTDKELQGKYLGKRIEVPMSGCEKGICGICQSIGHNPHLPSWNIVVVIGRMPISNVDILTIKLLDECST